MENELKHLTDTLMKVLDRYERHLSKGTPPEALEPHKSIIAGLMEKIKAHTDKPQSPTNSIRLGGQVPGPKDPQNKPQVISGAPDDNSARIAPDPEAKRTQEQVPQIPSTDIRPQVTTPVTPDNIDQMTDALTENDSLVNPKVETLVAK